MDTESLSCTLLSIKLFTTVASLTISDKTNFSYCSVTSKINDGVILEVGKWGGCGIGYWGRKGDKYFNFQEKMSQYPLFNL